MSELSERVRGTLSLPPLDRVKRADGGSYSQLAADVGYTLKNHLASGRLFADLDFSVRQRIVDGYLSAQGAAMRQLVDEHTEGDFNRFTRLHGDPFVLLMAEARRLYLDWGAR